MTARRQRNATLVAVVSLIVFAAFGIMLYGYGVVIPDLVQGDLVDLFKALVLCLFVLPIAIWGAGTFIYRLWMPK